jgi:hypothetical protein
MKDENTQSLPTDLRFRNTQGNIIPMHHAFLTIELNKFSRISAFVLPLVFSLLLWLCLPMLTQGWGSIMQFWMERIYQGNIDYSPVDILGRKLMMPYPLLLAEAPSEGFVWGNLIVCGVAFLVSFLMPSGITPLTYILRAALLIQASASLHRIFSPETFPYTLKIYVLDSLSLAVYLVFLLPAVLGFVYYIFDFGLWRKLLLTVMMLAYYFLTIPCQYMLHAYFIHEYTLLMLPIMYLLFGTLLDVLMFVSIYAFGMSWHTHEKSMQGRGL